jgi:hypothetical protein
VLSTLNTLTTTIQGLIDTQLIVSAAAARGPYTAHWNTSNQGAIPVVVNGSATSTIFTLPISVVNWNNRAGDVDLIYQAIAKTGIESLYDRIVVS